MDQELNNALGISSYSTPLDLVELAFKLKCPELMRQRVGRDHLITGSNEPGRLKEWLIIDNIVHTFALENGKRETQQPFDKFSVKKLTRSMYTLIIKDKYGPRVGPIHMSNDEE